MISSWNNLRSHGLPPRHISILRSTFRYVAIQLIVTALLAAITTLAAISGWLPAGVAALAWALFVMFGVVGGLGGLYDIWRHVRIIPYFKRHVGEIDTFLAGQALARSLNALDAAAAVHDVPPLSAFGFNDDLCHEPLTWHRATDGLRTVQVLLEILTREPAVEPETRAVIDDLRKLERALTRAAERDIPFCLLMLHGNATSGHEWSIRQGTAF